MKLISLSFNRVPTVGGVKLEIQSFPIIRECAAEILEGVKNQIKKARSGKAEDVYMLGIAVHLAERSYTKDTPEAATTRFNAFELILHAARMGHERAIESAISMMEKGDGTLQNITLARKLLEKEAEKSPVDWRRRRAEADLLSLEMNIQEGDLAKYAPKNLKIIDPDGILGKAGKRGEVSTALVVRKASL